MVWVIDHSKHRGTVFMVELMIANHADRHGDRAFASWDTLATDARCSRRQVARIIPRLLESGEIVLSEHGGGAGNTNVYAFPAVLALYGDEPIKGDNLSPIAGAKRVTKGWQKGDRKVTSWTKNSDRKVTSPGVNHALTLTGINVNLNSSPSPIFENKNGSEDPALSPSSAAPPFPLIEPPPGPAPPAVYDPSSFVACGQRGCVVMGPNPYCKDHGEPATGYRTRRGDRRWSSR
jgi:hypothetical protein